MKHKPPSWLSISGYEELVEKRMEQIFYESVDQREYPKYVDFRPYGGFFKNYPLGRYSDPASGESAYKQLDPRVKILKKFVRIYLWLTSPYALIAIFMGSLLAFYGFDLRHEHEIKSFILHMAFLYLLGILLIYPFAVSLLTMGIKGRAPSAPIYKNPIIMKFFRENGLGEIAAIESDMHYKKSFFLQIMISTLGIKWWLVLACLFLFGFGCFVQFSKIALGDGMLENYLLLLVSILAFAMTVIVAYAKIKIIFVCKHLFQKDTKETGRPT